MDAAQITSDLKQQIISNLLPPDLTEKLTSQLERLEKAMLSGFSIELEKEFEYLKFTSSLPFDSSSQDILDLARASQILDKNHYGLKVVKDRILEYISMLILNSRSNQKLKSPILAFVGLVGSGKTSLAFSIAETLGRKIIRIPFGGLGSVRQLRGSSRVGPQAEPGQIMKFVHDLGVNNPVILLDEIDRVPDDSKSDVMGVLLELLDPEQNSSFVDYFVDFPFDLSKALFIATANNTGGIANAVLDRLEIIEMPSYNDEEKIIIGKNYLLPKNIKEAGLKEDSLKIDEALWPQIVRPLGYDGGIRSLARTIDKIVRKAARANVEGSPPPYQITSDNIGQYLNL